MLVLGDRYWVLHAVVLACLLPLGLGMRALGRQLLTAPLAADLAAAFLMLEPLVLTFSHKFMPEIPMMAFLVWGAVLAVKGIHGGGWARFIAAGCLLGIAAAMKPTGAAVGLLIAILGVEALRESRGAQRIRLTAQLAITAALPLLGAGFWFRYARGLTSKAGAASFKLTHDWWEWSRLLFKSNLAIVLIGRWLHLYLMVPTVAWLIWDWRTAGEVLRSPVAITAWMAGAFALVILYGSHNFQHSYYALPLLLPLCLLLGDFVFRASQRYRRARAIRLGFLAVFAVTAVIRALPRFPPLGYDAGRIEHAMSSIPPGLAIATDRSTPVVSLIVLRRTGWSVRPDDLTLEAVRRMSAQGARVLIESSFGGWLPNATRAALPPPRYSDDQLRIYDLPGS
jgi:4-amino-4-deoxy-L-arabinose transferase-like glycosyltransferase